MNTGEALVKAVLEQPKEDTPRLVYADYLEENVGRVTLPCPRCGGEKEANAWMIVKPIGEPERKVPIGKQPCHLCEDDYGDPTGFITVPNYNAERAEFVRVQCEIARIGHLHPPADDEDRAVIHRAKALRKRERELRQTHAPVWFPIPGFLGESVRDRPHQIRWVRAVGSGEMALIVGDTERGFVSRITLPTEVFLGGYCRGCSGVGDDGGRLETHIICGTCKGTGTVPGVAKAVFSAHPVTTVTLADKTPWENETLVGEEEWGWWDENENRLDHDGPDDPGNIPTVLFDLMWKNNPANQCIDEAGRWILWDDPEIARDELSRACVTYGRSLVWPDRPDLWTV